MSELNNADALSANTSFVIKNSDSASFEYLTYGGFRNEVALAMLAQSALTYEFAVPVTVAPFGTIEALIFLDYVSVSNALTINLPDGQFAGQRVFVSINVLSGTALTSIVVKDTEDVTLFTITSGFLTVGFIVDQDMTWKRM